MKRPPCSSRRPTHLAATMQSPLVRALASFNFSLNQQAAAIRRRHTTESNDRKNHEWAFNNIRAWEYGITPNGALRRMPTSTTGTGSAAANPSLVRLTSFRRASSQTDVAKTNASPATNSAQQWQQRGRAVPAGSRRCHRRAGRQCAVWLQRRQLRRLDVSQHRLQYASLQSHDVQ